MRCEIRHTTEYSYPRPAWDSFNQVRLHPSGETRQSVRLFHLNVTPDAEITSHKDYFGAIVHHVHVHEHHRHLLIEAQAIVDTHAVTLPLPIPFSELRPERGRNSEFLVPSPRVPSGQWPELFGVARPGPGDEQTRGRERDEPPPPNPPHDDPLPTPSMASVSEVPDGPRTRVAIFDTEPPDDKHRDSELRHVRRRAGLSRRRRRPAPRSAPGTPAP